MMLGDQRGKVALITGASSGIGAATAVELAQKGIDTVLVGRRTDRLRDVAMKVEAAGASALVIEAELADAGAIARVMEQVVGWRGRLDILINNAGLSLGGPMDRTGLHEIRTMVDINLIALAYVTNLALPALKASGSGDIVNIGSVATRSLSPTSSVYTATKAAVDAYSECVRKELVDSSIRVMVLHPGFVRTDFLERMPDEEKRNSLQAIMDTFQPLTAEDVANCIAFAISLPRHAAISELVLRPSGQFS